MYQHQEAISNIIIIYSSNNFLKNIHSPQSLFNFPLIIIVIVIIIIVIIIIIIIIITKFMDYLIIFLSYCVKFSLKNLIQFTY